MKEQLPAAAAHSTQRAFTLVELLISVVVVTVIIFMVAQLMSNATTLTRASSKHIDTDTQARVVFDRIALDFTQMLKRTDVDCFVKQASVNYPGHSAGHGKGNHATSGQQLNDQIAVFSQGPGYYPSGAQSPVSLVAYRVNASPSLPSYLRLERMGKGLLWNGVSNLTNLNNPNTVYPIVFLPQTIIGIANAGKMWSDAVNNPSNATSEDSSYETIGPGVFRFEYYYLLKDGSLTDTPWNISTDPHTSITGIGLTKVQAIAVSIAVIDPASRSLVPVSSLFDLASDMEDFQTPHGHSPVNNGTGVVEAQWNQAVTDAISAGQTYEGSPFPAAAASAIRIYTRYFDLRTY